MSASRARATGPATTDEQRRAAQFLDVSAVLTGFDRVDLQGTGLADVYVRELAIVIGPPVADDFLSACARILETHKPGSKRDAAISSAILANDRFAPIARNVITMWYLGVWKRLPDTWIGAAARSDRDVDRVISPAAYVESLIWRAIGTHPPGAKQPGFGSWALPPGRGA